MTGIEALEALDRVEAFARKAPDAWAGLLRRIAAARAWLAEHPPKDRGPLDPSNVRAGFRIFGSTWGAFKEQLKPPANSVFRVQPAPKAGTPTWVVSFPNFLHGGFSCIVDARTGAMIEVETLIEG